MSDEWPLHDGSFRVTMTMEEGDAIGRALSHALNDGIIDERYASLAFMFAPDDLVEEAVERHNRRGPYLQPAPTTRATLNLTTGELDNLHRLAAAQRELGEIAEALFRSQTSKRAERKEFSTRLYRVKASLQTVELRLAGDDSD